MHVRIYIAKSDGIYHDFSSIDSVRSFDSGDIKLKEGTLVVNPDHIIAMVYTADKKPTTPDACE